MASDFPLTHRTPPQGHNDSDNSTIHLTPILNFTHLESNDREMDILNTFLLHKKSRSCIGPKKRKLSETQKESEAEMKGREWKNWRIQSRT